MTIRSARGDTNGKMSEHIAETKDSRLTVDHPLLGPSTGTRKEQIQIPHPEIFAFKDPSLGMGYTNGLYCQSVCTPVLEFQNNLWGLGTE